MTLVEQTTYVNVVKIIPNVKKYDKNTYLLIYDTFSTALSTRLKYISMLKTKLIYIENTIIY